MRDLVLTGSGYSEKIFFLIDGEYDVDQKCVT
jgi:hypothetical protein